MTPYTRKMPAHEYHADREFPGPTLSASTAATLVKQSPLHAMIAHPRLGGVGKAPTDAMDDGTILHALVFGQPVPVVVMDYPDYRTKAAQRERDDAREAGKVPVLLKEYADLEAVGRSIRDELCDVGLEPVGGEAETAFYWQEAAEAGAVNCRGMMDYHWLDRSSATILDLKTCRSAHPRACRSHVWEYRLDVQYAAYTSAVEHLRPDLAGRVDFVWAFAEILPAGSPKRAVVTIARPSGELRETGRQAWGRACRTWAQCLAADHWPGFADTGVVLEPPAWAMAEEEAVAP